jgi:anti-sigma28 factor (negative regulator of flagellin synthesis)
MLPCMALSENIRVRKASSAAPLGAHAETIARQSRVDELRRLVARGQYKVSPQRLALKILVKALNQR